ncbi:hypothetical protein RCSIMONEHASTD_16 [Rhodobacter phage RcSimone-Hastad]|nr:hypothetical protein RCSIMONEHASTD_16 [Rhodobacter phage RcSimone-Hastad]
MCTYCKHPQAQPLTAEEVQELKDEDLSELLVELDGKTYNDEDLYHCGGDDCSFKTADYHDLDDDGLCEECAEGAREYAAYVEDVRWTYRHSVL